MLVLVLRSVFLIMFCSSSTSDIKIVLVVTLSFQGFRPSLLQVPCPFHCIIGLSLILIFPLRLCDVSLFCNLSFSAPYPCVFFLQHGCSFFACFGLLRFLECFLRLSGSAGVVLLLVLFCCCSAIFYVCCVFIWAFRLPVCS